jgi:hypothetical protein
MQCYRHNKVETAVSCGRCDRPICPKCMIPGPAGMRCPDCASLRSTALYKIHPLRLALAVVAGLITAAIGSAILSVLTFWVIFAGPIYGGAVAEVILRASGRKRGPALEVIGVACIILAFLGHAVVPLLLIFTPVQGPARAALPMGYGVTSLLFQLLGCGLAVSACYARLKYA